VYYHQNNLDDLTEILRRVLVKVVYIPIIDLMDVYEIVQISYFADLAKANFFLQNWNAALNNLEPSVRELVLYDIKLVYEARMGNNKDLGDPMLYEEYRFELRRNAEEAALQAKCTKCNIVLNLSDKTSKIVTRNFNRPLHIRCPECKNINCLVIPSL
jgi:phage FluMu protein Com